MTLSTPSQTEYASWKSPPQFAQLPIEIDVLRLGHLVVEQLRAERHLEVSVPDTMIRSDWRGVARGDRAEALEVGARAAGLHHLDGAAGEAEEHVPERVLAGQLMSLSSCVVWNSVTSPPIPESIFCAAIAFTSAERAR